ncbi:VOC family protein [Goodfellowiella coeruleoviolacea]|uniref:Glyoxalase-like domain-containing protein n=1 Tax=Goodfellowiella coeruleoviolacea TaxID=334858 RepID=A0AAE3GDM4_9PSEU|nr:VOC family protein [Goodfellowiella coeruleoviolacea]MCP2165344.1 Glyoxalase-like domain-containing protein [Goodfellowiella coeruleoviolacea]
MATRLVDIVVDAADPVPLARFWADLLGWRVEHVAEDQVTVRATDIPGSTLKLTFVPVADAKAGKNRVHLDLASTSAAHQRDLVERAGRLGAEPADIGQRRELPWVVLADPQGNEFCVLEPRPVYQHTGALAAVVVDAVRPGALAEFWAGATGWAVVDSQAEFASVRPSSGVGPWLEFVADSGAKRGKNRVHLDLAPTPGGDLAAEVDRLCALGAVPVDIGQGAVSWRVLADPEGNEFCVLTPR